MVSAPKRVDGVLVHNTTDKPVTVTVTYDNHVEHKDITVSQQIPPGENYHFVEQELDMGSWKAVAPVTSISASQDGASHKLAPSVSGVVKKLHVHVKNGCSLEQGHAE